MQGIQLFEYKFLMEHLDKLRQASSFEQEGLVALHEEKLKEIYTNYKKAREEVAIIIGQFEDHKIAIRRLVANHKLHHKSLLRK